MRESLGSEVVTHIGYSEGILYGGKYGNLDGSELAKPRESEGGSEIGSYNIIPYGYFDGKL